MGRDGPPERVALPVDRLSSLLQRFHIRAHLSHNGRLCEQAFFPAAGHGYLHVLRAGRVQLRHAPQAGVPLELQLEQPSLLFYPRPLAHSLVHGPEQHSDFTCAQVEFDGGPANPLARALPPLLVLPLQQVSGLEPALALLFAETEQVRCGQRLLADRLFEVVLIQLLRWLLDHGGQLGLQSGLLAGLADVRLARALTAVHEQPQDAWTLERLAQTAGMSRTAFANHFRQVLGVTPGDYLADWRLTLAQSGLRQGRSLQWLAAELGYGSASALSRLFVARCGQSPRQWLQQQRAG